MKILLNYICSFYVPYSVWCFIAMDLDLSARIGIKYIHFKITLFTSTWFPLIVNKNAISMQYFNLNLTCFNSSTIFINISLDLYLCLKKSYCILEISKIMTKNNDDFSFILSSLNIYDKCLLFRHLNLPSFYLLSLII